MTILNVPGLFNSGPEHWQSYWEQLYPNCRRVLQKEWEAPHRDDWVEGIEQAVACAEQPILLTAHSTACAAVAHWAAVTRLRIAGALLVGPTDVESPNYPLGPKGFQPMTLARLPFPSITVASEDDPWASLERAQYFAMCWGSQFVNIGAAGHINSDSKLGDWPQGRQLLESLLRQTTQRTQP